MKISRWGANSAREMRIAKIAGNANVGPKVWNTRKWKADGKTYAVMVMNKVPRAKSLYNAINNGTITNFQQVRNMVAKMHAAGIHHGNMHGENILVYVANNGSLKLVPINFGAAKYHPKIRNANSAVAMAIHSRGWRGGSVPVRNQHGNTWYRRPGREQPIRSNKNMLEYLQVVFNNARSKRANGPSRPQN